MRAEPVHRVQYALMFLRKKGVPVERRDISKQIARLFASRPQGPPLSFWLRCATHMQDVVKETKPVRDLVTNAMVAAFQAATPETTWDVEDSELLHRALTVLADLLPRGAHDSYLELKIAGAIPYASWVNPKPVQSGFARLWLAIVRLSPRPGNYVLRPRYR